MAILRTDETAQKYKDLIATGYLGGECVLCTAVPVKVFTNWKIVANAFPYDQIASTHNMILPLRHAAEEFLTEEEIKELQEIKASHVHKEYDFIIEGTYKMKSIPAHFHLHMIVLKS